MVAGFFGGDFGDVFGAGVAALEAEVFRQGSLGSPSYVVHCGAREPLVGVWTLSLGR